MIYDQKEEIENLFKNNINSDEKLSPKTLFILIVFALCFIVMVIGVAMFEWWFEEMIAVFFIGAIVIGIIGSLDD